MPFNDAEFEFILKGEISVVDNVFMNGQMIKILEVKLVNDIIFCYQNWNIKTKVLNNQPRKLLPVSVSHYIKVCKKFPDYKPSTVLSLENNTYYLFTADNISFNECNKVLTIHLNENMKSKIGTGMLGNGRLNLSTVPFKMLNFDNSLDKYAVDFTQTDVKSEYNQVSDITETEAYSFLYQDTGNFESNEKETIITVKNPKIAIAYQQWSFSTPNLNNSETRKVTCLEFSKMVENANKYNLGNPESVHFTPTTTLIIDETILIGVITNIVKNETDENSFNIVVNFDMIDNTDLKMEKPHGNNIDFFMNIDDTPSDQEIISVDRFIQQGFIVKQNQTLNIPDEYGKCFVPEALNFDNYVYNSDAKMYLETFKRIGQNFGTININVEETTDKTPVKIDSKIYAPNFGNNVGGSQFTLTDYHVVTLWIRDLAIPRDKQTTPVLLKNVTFYDKYGDKIQVIKCDILNPENDDGTPNNVFRTGLNLENLIDDDDETESRISFEDVNLGNISFTLQEEPYYYTFKTGSIVAVNDWMMTGWDMKYGRNVFSEDHQDEVGYKKDTILNNTTYPLDGSKFILHPNVKLENKDHLVTFWIKTYQGTSIKLDEIEFFDEDRNRVLIRSLNKPITNPDGSMNTLTDSTGSFYNDLSNLLIKDREWHGDENNVGTINFVLAKKPAMYRFSAPANSTGIPMTWQITVDDISVDDAYVPPNSLDIQFWQSSPKRKYPFDNSFFLISDKPPKPDNIVDIWFKEILDNNSGLQLSEVTFYDENHEKLTIEKVETAEFNLDGSDNAITDGSSYQPLSALIDGATYSKWYASGGTGIGTIRFTTIGKAKYYTFTTAGDSKATSRMPLIWETERGGFTKLEDKTDVSGYTTDTIRDNTVYPLDGSKFNLDTEDDISDVEVTFWFKTSVNENVNQIQLSEIKFYDINNYEIPVLSSSKGDDTNEDGTPNTIETDRSIGELRNFHDDNRFSYWRSTDNAATGETAFGTIKFNLLSFPSYYTIRTSGGMKDSMITSWSTTVNGITVEENHIDEEGYTPTSVSDDTIYPLNGSKYVLGNAPEIVIRDDNENTSTQKKEKTSVLFEVYKMITSLSGRAELELSDISFYDRNGEKIKVTGAQIGKTHNNNGYINYFTESDMHPLENVYDDDPSTIWESINYRAPIHEEVHQSSNPQYMINFYPPRVGGTIAFDLEKVPYSFTFTTGNFNKSNYRMIVEWGITVNGIKTDFRFANEDGFTADTIKNNEVYPAGDLKYQISNKYTHASSSLSPVSAPPRNYGVPYASKFYNGDLINPVSDWDVGFIKSTFFLIPEWLHFINKGSIHIKKSKSSRSSNNLELNNTHDEGLLNSIITVAKPSKTFLTSSNWTNKVNFTDEYFNATGFGKLQSDVTNEFPCPNLFINEGTIDVLNDIIVVSKSDFSLINAVINQNGGVIKIPKLINKSTDDIFVSGIREVINTENFNWISENPYDDWMEKSRELNSKIEINTVNSHSLNCTTSGIMYCYLNQGHILIENVIAGLEQENVEENYVIDGIFSKKDGFEYRVDGINTYGIQYMGALNIDYKENEYDDDVYDAVWGVNQEVLRTTLQAYKKISFKHKMIDPLSAYDLYEGSPTAKDVEDMMGNTGVIEIDNIKNFSNLERGLSNEVCCGIKNLIQIGYPQVMDNMGTSRMPTPILIIKKVINYGYGDDRACMGVRNVLVNYGAIRIDIIDNKAPSNYVINKYPPFCIGIKNVVQNGYAFKNPEQFSDSPDYNSSLVEVTFSQRSFLPPFPPENYRTEGLPNRKSERFKLKRGYTIYYQQGYYDQGHISIGLVNNSHQTQNKNELHDAVSIGIERYGGISYSPGIMDENNYDIYDVQDITSYIRTYVMKYDKLATMWSFPTQTNTSQDSNLRKKTATKSWTDEEILNSPYFVGARNPVAMYYKYESGLDAVATNSKIFFPMNWGIVSINSINSGDPDIPKYQNNSGSSLGIKHLITSLGSIQILSITSCNEQPFRSLNTTRYTKVNTPTNPEVGKDMGYGNDYRELPLRFIDYDIVDSIKANEDSDGDWTRKPPKNISVDGVEALIVLPRGHVNNVLDDRMHEDTEGVNTHYQNHMIATTGAGHQSNYRFPYGLVARDLGQDSKFSKIDDINAELTNSNDENIYDLMKCKGMSCGVLRTLNYGAEAPGLWVLTDFTQPFIRSNNYKDYEKSYTKLQYSHLFKQRFAAAADKDGYYRMPASNVPTTLDQEGDEAIKWFGQLIDQTDTFDDTVEEVDEVLPYIVNNQINNYMIENNLFKNVSVDSPPESHAQSGRFFNGAALFPYITREAIPDPDNVVLDSDGYPTKFVDDKLTANGFRTDRDILFTDEQGNVDRTTYPLRPWTYQTLQTERGNILTPIYEWPSNYNFNDHNNFTANPSFEPGTVPENNHMSMWPQFTNQLLAAKIYLGWDYDDKPPGPGECSDNPGSLGYCAPEDRPENYKTSIGYAGPLGALNTVARYKDGDRLADILHVDNFFRYHYNCNLPPGFNPQFIQGGQLSFPELNRDNKDFIFQYGILKFDNLVVYADPYRWDGFATVSVGKELMSSLNPINFNKFQGEVTFYRQENTHDDYSWFRHKHETGNTYYGLTYENKAYQSSHIYRLYYATFGPHYGLGLIIQNSAKTVFDSFVGNENYLKAQATQEQIDKQMDEAYSELGAQIGGSVVAMGVIAYAGGITALAVGVGTAVTSAVYYGLGALICCCTVS